MASMQKMGRNEKSILSSYDTKSRCGWAARCLDPPLRYQEECQPTAWCYEDVQLGAESLDSYGIEGQNRHTGKPRLFTSSRQSYCWLLQADQQGARSCCVQIRKLDTQQLAVLRFAYHHSGEAFLKQVVNCVKAYWSIGQTQRGVHSKFQHGYHASVLPCWWETLTAQGRVKRYLLTSNP